MMSRPDIHEKAKAAYCILDQDSRDRFMTYHERKRNEKIFELLSEIMEGTS